MTGSEITREEAIKVIQEKGPKTCKMVDGRLVGGFPDTESDFGQAIAMAVAALQEPVRKHGRWIKISEPDENDNIKCRCSECHAEDVHSKSAIVPFCWKCGADMMEGEQE